MDYDDAPIRQDVIRLLREKLSVSETLLSTESWDEPLAGSTYDFSAVALAYLFFEIEKKYTIRIDRKNLQSYKFCTINQIVEAVCQATIPITNKS